MKTLSIWNRIPYYRVTIASTIIMHTIIIPVFSQQSAENIIFSLVAKREEYKNVKRIVLAFFFVLIQAITCKRNIVVQKHCCLH